MRETAECGEKRRALREGILLLDKLLRCLNDRFKGKERTKERVELFTLLITLINMTE